MAHSPGKKLGRYVSASIDRLSYITWRRCRADASFARFLGYLA
jgi:hypothetical protein